MAIEVKGTYTVCDPDKGPDSALVDIPAGATCCIVGTALWTTGGAEDLTATLDGQSLETIIIGDRISSYHEQAGLYYVDGFSTGNGKTFAWTWDVSPDEGVKYLFLFLSGVDTSEGVSSAIRDSDTSYTTSDIDVDLDAPAIDAADSDLGVLLVSAFSADNTDITNSGAQTSRIAYDADGCGEAESGMATMAGSAPNITMGVDDTNQAEICVCTVIAESGGISISVSDQLTTVENIGPNLPLAGISKFDSINITEFKNLLTTMAPSVFENMTVTEFVQFLISIKPNLFETITIQEVVTLLKDFGIEQHDQVTIAEVVCLVINLLFSTHDVVTITENIQAALSLLDFEISEHETITIQEVITLLKDFNIEKYDFLTINEIVTLVMNIIFSGHDTVTITENIQAALSALDVEISEFETINITEFVSAALSGIIAMNRFELINILESVQAEIRLAGIETHDILNITESILLTIPVSFSLHDVVHIAENITLSMPDLATSQDLVNITESIIVGLDSMLFSSFDSVAISESITMLLEWLGALPLGNFTAKSRAYAFTAKSRTYAYTARSRLN